MSKEYPIEILKQKMLTLPPEIQEAMLSVDLANTVKKIGQKHKIHIDKLDSLFDQTSYVMLGLEHPNNFVKNLQGALELPPAETKAIAEEINEQVFGSIRESLKTLTTQNSPPASSLPAAIPALIPSATPTIAEQKLSGMVTSPKEEIHVDEKAGAIKHLDPYRETVD
jgi:hypothetical protein